MLIDQKKALASFLEKINEITPNFSEKANNMLDQIQDGMLQVQLKASEMTNEMKN